MNLAADEIRHSFLFIFIYFTDFFFFFCLPKPSHVNLCTGAKENPFVIQLSRSSFASRIMLYFTIINVTDFDHQYNYYTQKIDILVQFFQPLTSDLPQKAKLDKGVR